MSNEALVAKCVQSLQSGREKRRHRAARLPSLEHAFSCSRFDLACSLNNNSLKNTDSPDNNRGFSVVNSLINLQNIWQN